MRFTYQDNVEQPTKELVAQVLKDLTEAPDTNTLIDEYRQLKRKMAEAQASEAVDKFVDEMKETQDYKEWLAEGLRKDEKRRKKRIPDSDLKRVALFIQQKKNSLSAVIPTA